jgi:very-short-patch-repair endonuclease
MFSDPSNLSPKESQPSSAEIFRDSTAPSLSSVSPSDLIDLQLTRMNSDPSKSEKALLKEVRSMHGVSNNGFSISNCLNALDTYVELCERRGYWRHKDQMFVRALTSELLRRVELDPANPILSQRLVETIAQVIDKVEPANGVRNKLLKIAWEYVSELEINPKLKVIEEMYRLSRGDRAWCKEISKELETTIEKIKREPDKYDISTLVQAVRVEALYWSRSGNLSPWCYDHLSRSHRLDALRKDDLLQHIHTFASDAMNPGMLMADIITRLEPNMAELSSVEMLQLAKDLAALNVRCEAVFQSIAERYLEISSDSDITVHINMMQAFITTRFENLLTPLWDSFSNVEEYAKAPPVSMLYGYRLFLAAKRSAPEWLSVSVNHEFSDDSPKAWQNNRSDFEHEVGSALTALVSQGCSLTFRNNQRILGYEIDQMIEFAGRKIALECDGEMFHQVTGTANAKMRGNDVFKDLVLRGAGYEVVRIGRRKWLSQSENARPAFLLNQIREA